MNQGDAVGNRKGLVFIVIQNGEALPSGTPSLVSGTVAPSTASLPSGTAFSGSLGAAQTTNKWRAFSINLLLFFSYRFVHCSYVTKPTHAVMQRCCLVFSACGLCVLGVVSGDCTKRRADQRRVHRRILHIPGTHRHTHLVRLTGSLFFKVPVCSKC